MQCSSLSFALALLAIAARARPPAAAVGEVKFAESFLVFADDVPVLCWPK